MLPKDVINKEQVCLGHPAASKKKALEAAADLLASGQNTLSAALIFEKLLERERLGSTGLANGIALPHARAQGLTQARGAFLTLDTGVDFDAMDEKPVDLIFALLVPDNATQEHLNLLAALAGLFRDPHLCKQIREASTIDQIIHLLTESPDNNAASDNSPGSVRLPA